MLQRKFITLACVGAVFVAPGCATGAPSGDELRNTIYSTHRMVQNLDANLAGTVSDLTQTAATLTARMDSTDQELRNLSSLAVENQRKLEQLQASLDSLTTTLYRHFNLSPPPPVSTPSFTPGVTPSPGAPRGGVVVQPPRTVPQSTLPPTTQPQFQQPTQQPQTQQPQGSPAPTPVPGGVSAEAPPPLESTGVVPQTAPPISAAPTQPQQQPQQPGVDEITHYRAAQQLYAREDYANALKQFEEHLQMFPNSANAANAAYWKAHCYFKLGDYPQAIIGFEDLRSKYPTSDKVPTAMHNQAVAYSRLGQNQRAIELFEMLIRDYPNDPATVGAQDKLRQLQGQ
jgi:tol-pal system protein YbgF